MKLGIIISAATEENFRRTAELGLDFVEFCINGGNDGSELFDHMDEIKTWMKKYSLGVGSIGRWKTIEQLPDGTLDPFELEMAVKLMNAAKELGCSNYVCGCNYQPDRTLYENYTAAIAFFRYVLEHRPEGVDVSVYNCHKGNFVITPKEWEVVIGQLPELNIKYDPAHALDFGRDYLEELAAWGDRVKHVHLKGSVFVNGQRIDDTPCGLDQTDWKSFLAVLRARGFDGTMSLEPHGDVWVGDLKERGIRYSIQYMRNLMV